MRAKEIADHFFVEDDHRNKNLEIMILRHIEEMSTKREERVHSRAQAQNFVPLQMAVNKIKNLEVDLLVKDARIAALEEVVRKLSKIRDGYSYLCCPLCSELDCDHDCIVVEAGAVLEGK